MGCEQHSPAGASVAVPVVASTFVQNITAYCQYTQLNGPWCETKPITRLKETSGPSVDGPLDLCCPIMLELFKDQVKTLHGQAYEREACTSVFALRLMPLRIGGGHDCGGTRYHSSITRYVLVWYGVLT